MIKTVSLVLMASGLSWSCQAASCDDYPSTPGINAELVEGGIKIVATGTAAVSFDEASSVADARDEATLLAKAEISKFLTEGVRSDQALNRAVQETKSMQGESKSNARKEVVERLKQVSSSSQALLKGVVPLGECYTKGQEFRVSVGVKPETMGMADTLGQGMAQSPAGGPNGAPSVGPQGRPPTQKPNGMDGFSRTDGLKKF
ncbi:hypothetical protein [Methylobacterium sp. WL19]|uniref:hypothetical protein n=1 Tax=Methylobacterium sp. WL19 TaxID=2603896 RepID=UPI0011CA2C1F|nr:hypothetical protein [Methylobacterium sp. WL19]TXN29127.1 hypothetical protein FV220_07585 [Methylobacterium sp. WL19]